MKVFTIHGKNMWGKSLSCRFKDTTYPLRQSSALHVLSGVVTLKHPECDDSRNTNPDSVVQDITGTQDEDICQSICIPLMKFSLSGLHNSNPYSIIPDSLNLRPSPPAFKGLEIPFICLPLTLQDDVEI